MIFIGREQELSSLETMYQTPGFQMLILYGRRRIGKTTLLNKFSENKNPLFYTGIESKDEENRNGLGNAVFAHYNRGASGVTFHSYADLLGYITSALKQDKNRTRELIILDEYPYIAEYSGEFASVLQREIDHEWKNLNIMLILCGSSITFMEEEVLGEKSPLYGRRTGQIDLMPMDYLTSSRFVRNYTEEEKAIVYGFTGGVPKYLSILNPALTLEDNIKAGFFQTAGFFYEEPKNLLRQEFRDVSLYFAILNAIAGGSTQVTEIAGKTGFDTAKISQALRKLETVRIIKKNTPILNEKNRKLRQYIISDYMFRFWFRFVTRGTAAIERNYGEQYFDSSVRPFLHDYMGLVFEHICQEYTLLQGLKGSYGGLYTDVGKWRGTDPIEKCPADIDVVCIDQNQKTAVIGECKFKNATFGREEYEKLLDRGRLIAPYRVTRYLVFSLSGISKWVREELKHDSAIETISMKQLFS